MKTGIPTYRNIWDISYPIIISLVAQNLINVIDTAFLGRVGEVELGASAIAGLFYISLFMLGFGFGTGAQILMARRNGESNYHDIGKIFNNSIYFLLALGLALFFIIKIFSPVFLKSFISSPAIYAATHEFLRFRIYGIFFAFMNVIFRAFYISITKTRMLTFAAVLMAAVNIILDYLLIFGNWGFPKMGIAGAGLASSIAEGSAALFFLFLTLRTVDIRKYGLFKRGKPDLAVVGKTLEISVYVMMQNFASLGGWFVFFMIVEHMGERTLAISNIIRSIYMVMMIPIWGFSSAVNTLVSNSLGAKHPDKVIPIIIKASKMSFLSILAVIAASLLIPRLIISIYTSDPGLISATVPTLYVILGAMMLFSVTMMMFSGVSGTANTNIAMAIELFTIAIYLLAAYLLAVVFHQRIEVVWLCEYIYFIILGSL
ncbi:MAG TPA: MATE family efflux transporter, partial [Bacteroidales bacterium]|nr:MATE family efflux transporter [Bacteroidales bacterium]